MTGVGHVAIQTWIERIGPRRRMPGALLVVVGMAGPWWKGYSKPSEATSSRVTGFQILSTSWLAISSERLRQNEMRLQELRCHNKKRQRSRWHHLTAEAVAAICRPWLNAIPVDHLEHADILNDVADARDHNRPAERQSQTVHRITQVGPID